MRGATRTSQQRAAHALAEAEASCTSSRRQHSVHGATGPITHHAANASSHRPPHAWRNQSSSVPQCTAHLLPRFQHRTIQPSAGCVDSVPPFVVVEAVHSLGAHRVARLDKGLDVAVGSVPLATTAGCVACQQAARRPLHMSVEREQLHMGRTMVCGSACPCRRQQMACLQCATPVECSPLRARCPRGMRCRHPSLTRTHLPVQAQPAMSFVAAQQVWKGCHAVLKHHKLVCINKTWGRQGRGGRHVAGTP